MRGLALDPLNAARSPSARPPKSITVFITIRHHDRLADVNRPDGTSIEVIHASIKKAGTEIGEGHVFIHDKDDEPTELTGPTPSDHIQRGAA
ncbi:hypothetical protein KHC28_08820 [Ancylobacter sonchi]|uniref:hypothetical protein n=1 Tax=Ancylobacter sonchi TaxID=1937790 RepID=UPI001BD51EE9|nr:hypothetical protein [Ancylobacter sonchi]MBS7533758.1 hypothetical protein [Ancylobacter sonchi]